MFPTPNLMVLHRYIALRNIVDFFIHVLIGKQLKNVPKQTQIAKTLSRLHVSVNIIFFGLSSTKAARPVQAPFRFEPIFDFSSFPSYRKPIHCEDPKFEQQQLESK